MALWPDSNLYQSWKEWAAALNNFFQGYSTEQEERFSRAGDLFLRHSLGVKAPVSGTTYQVALTRYPWKITNMQATCSGGTLDITVTHGGGPNPVVTPTWDIGIPAPKTAWTVNATHQIALPETLNSVLALSVLDITVANFVTTPVDLVVTIEGEAVSWNR